MELIECGAAWLMGGVALAAADPVVALKCIAVATTGGVCAGVAVIAGIYAYERTTQAMHDRWRVRQLISGDHAKALIARTTDEATETAVASSDEPAGEHPDEPEQGGGLAAPVLHQPPEEEDAFADYA